MANQDERAVIAAVLWIHRKGCFQAFCAGNIQVVGRLIQDDQVVGGADDASNHHATTLAAGEIANAFLLLRTREQECAGQIARLLFTGAESAFIGSDHSLQVLPHGEHGVNVLLRLPEVAHLDLRAHLEFAGIRLQIAKQCAHQCGLAGAVRANNSDTVERLDCKVQLIEEDLVTVTL